MTIRFWNPDGSQFLEIEGMNTPTETLNEEAFRNDSIRLMLDLRRKPTETEALMWEHFDQITEVH